MNEISFYVNNKDGFVDKNCYIYSAKTINKCFEKIINKICYNADIIYYVSRVYKGQYIQYDFLFDDTDPLFDSLYKCVCAGNENTKKHPDWNTAYNIKKTTLNKDFVLDWMYNCKDVGNAEYTIVIGSNIGVFEYKIKRIDNINNEVSFLCYDINRII